MMCRKRLGASALALRGFVLLQFLLVACVSAEPPTTSTGEAVEARGVAGPPEGGYFAGRALLVGCSRYEHLSPRWQLDGPTNDVQLLARLLTGPMFRFDPAKVERLAGWPTDPAQRPTRDNIAREFERLAETVGPQDQVVILLSGHGSRQPADDDPADIEADGFDEIFLPSDVKDWDGAVGKVRNSITDDELRAWLDKIRARAGFVWVIIDACHSGTMTRGSPAEKPRRLPEEELIPKEVLDAARKAAAEDTPPQAAMLGMVPEATNLAALYASQPFETTPELPRPDARGQIHGLFTYTLANILGEASSTLTYRELAERVGSHYRAKRGPQPTPMYEGGGIDREVLGLREWPERPRLLLAARRQGSTDRVWLEAGQLHGITERSILAVYPPSGAEDAANPVGHAEVVEVQPYGSLVKTARTNKLRERSRRPLMGFM